MDQLSQMDDHDYYGRVVNMKCRACGKEIIFLMTCKGKVMPVNKETGGVGDIDFDPQKHVTHFSDCPAADKFRKQGAVK